MTGEIGYFTERRFGAKVRDGFLADLAAGSFTLDCGEQDLAQIRELTLRYADLPLGLVQKFPQDIPCGRSIVCTP